MRINRCVQLYTGKNNQGVPMGAWTNDGTIKLLQQYFHNMQFQNTFEGRKQHSGNVALIYKSIKFTNDEYTRISDPTNLDAKYEGEKDDIETTDVGNRKKKTITPQRVLEKHLIAELLLLSEATVEKEDRKYHRNLYWEKMSSITTKLQQESPQERSKRLMDQMRTSEEKAISHITDELSGIHAFGSGVMESTGA